MDNYLANIGWLLLGILLGGLIMALAAARAYRVGFDRGWQEGHDARRYGAHRFRTD